jgi:hypothetical protein
MMSKEQFKFSFKNIDDKTYQQICKMIPYPYKRVNKNDDTKNVIILTTGENMLSLYIEIKEYLNQHFEVERV